MVTALLYEDSHEMGVGCTVAVDLLSYDSGARLTRRQFHQLPHPTAGTVGATGTWRAVRVAEVVVGAKETLVVVDSAEWDVIDESVLTVALDASEEVVTS